MPARSLRIVILAIVAFAGGLLVARALMPSRAELPQTERATVLPSPMALPALDLVDQDGNPIGAGFFKDHWTIVFFGFTSCPDICPTTLTTLSRVTRQLADLPATERPRVLLITVDPERDNPSHLAAYVRFYDPAFLGATGSSRGDRRGRGRVPGAVCEGEPARRRLHDGPRLGHLRRRAVGRHRRVLLGAA